MSKRKYVYCVMWAGDKKRGMTEILRDTRITTYADAENLTDFLQKYQGDDTLLITNWKQLARRCPIIKESPNDT